MIVLGDGDGDGYAHPLVFEGPKTSLIQHPLTKPVRRFNQVHQASHCDMIDTCEHAMVETANLKFETKANG